MAVTQQLDGSVDYRVWKAEREAGYAALINQHYDQAEERFRNALAIASRRSLFDPYVAAGHVDLAEVSRARGDLEDAERHLKRAITLLERRLGSAHLDVLKVSQSLADLYVEQKRYPQAEVLLMRLLSTAERVLGAGHPDLQPLLRLLTLALVAQRRLPDARLWLMRLVSYTDHSNGSASLDPAATFRHYADELAAQGRQAEALLLYGYVLDLHLRENGGDGEETAIDHICLGQMLLAGDECDNARQHLTHALELLEKCPHPRPAETAQAQRLLGQVQQRLGDAVEAAAWYARALATVESQDGAQSLEAAELRHRLALMHFAAGEPARALETAQAALTIREQQLKPGHPDIAALLKDLADFCTALDQPEQAAALLERMQLLLAATPAG